ncbi:Two component transcriptional regulator, winged helix family [Frankia canadensis]|uniref:Sensory transduction protein RegX3 n=1 Tax=Frankia canadensis TaxID=1836972 RepID=A0A2I2KLE7_9ACTN|nr:response regulator transcription factor [Frankia canadensis]SNQ46485.1 Two component transcriptional regulator, winged helix family [Frankia canadensis]SOU53775.1 Two component transcriptional regulator, winged helix family [Frankia canadensis]
MRLLLAEGDEDAARDLAAQLRRHGFTVGLESTGAGVLAWPTKVDCVLLGLDLPDLDALEVCRRLRSYCQVPLIALSSTGSGQPDAEPRDSELDCVLALQAGFDDYVPAPFLGLEVAARIDAVLRRARPIPLEHDTIPRQPPGTRDLITHGRLVINLRTREVTVGTRQITLTRKEFGLLVLLATEPGTVFSRERIMASVWQDETSLSSRTLDTHVATLRAKLDSRAWIVTVHGIGFRIGGDD